jgi:hypothetical protein
VRRLILETPQSAITHPQLKIILVTLSPAKLTPLVGIPRVGELEREDWPSAKTCGILTIMPVNNRAVVF